MKKASCEIGSAKADHFLVRIDRRARLGGERPRQNARIRKGDHRDSTATHNDLAEVSKTDSRQSKRWQPLRKRTENLHAGTGIEVHYTNHDSRGDDREQKARNALVGLEQKDRGECTGAHCECGPVRLPAEDAFGDAHKITQWADAFGRETEELRQLADQHCKRDAVHVAVANRLGKELCDEPQAQHTYQNTHQTRHHRHHARDGYRTHRIATRERKHNSENHGRERRVRSQDENAAGTKECVREQGHNRGTQPIDSGNARSQRIGDTDRHQHRSQYETSHYIARKPSGLVFAQELNSR